MKNYDICHIDLKNNQGTLIFLNYFILIKLILIGLNKQKNQNERTYFMLNFQVTGKRRTFLIFLVLTELFMLDGLMINQLS